MSLLNMDAALTMGRLHMHLIWKVKVTHQSLQLYLSTLKITAHRVTFEHHHQLKCNTTNQLLYVYSELRKQLTISIFTFSKI